MAEPQARTGSPRILDVTETAKILQTELKREFPGTKFSVKSDRYAGGASIDVKRNDGTTEDEVAPITSKFEGAGFDGMIDLKYFKAHWLRPDGSMLLAHTDGTEGSRGCVPAEDNTNLTPVIPADAERVRFGADFVFVRRTSTDGESG